MKQQREKRNKQQRAETAISFSFSFFNSSSFVFNLNGIPEDTTDIFTLYSQSFLLIDFFRERKEERREKKGGRDGEGEERGRGDGVRERGGRNSDLLGHLFIH